MTANCFAIQILFSLGFACWCVVLIYMFGWKEFKEVSIILIKIFFYGMLSASIGFVVFKLALGFGKWIGLE